MTAPNIVNVTSIIGMTAAVSVAANTTSVVLSNGANSNRVLKINTLIVSNSSTSSTVDITVKYWTLANGGGTGYNIASTITIPADTSLVVIGKDNPIYLEEDKSITAFASQNSSGINVICSYEQIS